MIYLRSESINYCHQGHTQHHSKVHLMAFQVLLNRLRLDGRGRARGAAAKDPTSRPKGSGF